MSSIPRRILPTLCIGVMLVVSVLAASQIAQTWADIRDEAAHNKALDTYRQAANMPPDIAFQPDTRRSLRYFQSSGDRLKQKLFAEALKGPGVIAFEPVKEVPQPRTWVQWVLGRTPKPPIYFASSIQPQSALGQRYGLDRIDRGFPTGKQAFVFCRYEKGQLKLLHIETFTHGEFDFEGMMKRFKDVIPLERVRKLV